MNVIVREATPQEVHIRVDYFLSAPAEYLELLGVVRARVPSADDWVLQHTRDIALPIEERRSMYLVWLVDDQPIGFSTADQIEFGEQAKMHLHVLKPDNRRAGLGTACVRLSVALYFDLLRLKRLYCQPNAFNVAPNRTLQKVGFRYVETLMATPSPINFHQPVTRWVIHRDQVEGSPLNV